MLPMFYFQSFVFTYDQFDDLCTSSYYDDAVPLVSRFFGFKYFYEFDDP